MLDQLIEKVGDAKHPPPPPKGGIPKQWLAPWIRWPIRVVLLPFILLDLTMQKWARWLIRPPYLQEGKCLQRGNCCHYLMLQKSKGLLGKLYYLWYTQVQGFFPRSSEEYEHQGKAVWVMGCRYLQPNGRCKHYKLRPVVCRKWPLISHFGHPQILKGCGFRAVTRCQKTKDSL